jgi:hypothetical protein
MIKTFGTEGNYVKVRFSRLSTNGAELPMLSKSFCEALPASSDQYPAGSGPYLLEICDLPLVQLASGCVRNDSVIFFHVEFPGGPPVHGRSAVAIVECIKCLAWRPALRHPFPVSYAWLPISNACVHEQGNITI